MLNLYYDELFLSPQSAFLSHGLSTWMVLLSGWALFCVSIDALAACSTTIRSSKLQSDARTNDIALRALAKRVVVRNWVAVLLQTVLFAPFLKMAFPLGQWRTAMTRNEYAIFVFLWFISNDFIFTMFHFAFHRSPWLYKVAHKEHHTWKAPFAWMSHAMSLWEMAANSVGVMFVPLCHSLLLQRTTPLELVWVLTLWSQLIGCIEHSGYNAIPPLAPLFCLQPKWCPTWLFSTTRHHDDHHQYFQGNYGGYLAIWDVLMGTILKVRDDDKHSR